MSSRRAGRTPGPRRRAPALAARPDDVGAGDDHGAGPAVVADRQVLPVGHQRLGVRAGSIRPTLRRVVLGGVEVDVVGDLERQPQRRPSRSGCTAPGAPSPADQVGDPGPHRRPAVPALGHERVQRRRGEHVVAQGRRQVEDVLPDRDPDPRRRAAGRRPRTAGCPARTASRRGSRWPPHAAPSCMRFLSAHRPPVPATISRPLARRDGGPGRRRPGRRRGPAAFPPRGLLRLERSRLLDGLGLGLPIDRDDLGPGRPPSTQNKTPTTMKITTGIASVKQVLEALAVRPAGRREVAAEPVVPGAWRDELHRRDRDKDHEQDGQRLHPRHAERALDVRVGAAQLPDRGIKSR